MNRKEGEVQKLLNDGMVYRTLVKSSYRDQDIVALAKEICALFEPQSKPQDADLREQLTIAIDGCYSTEGSACKLHPVFQPQKFLNLLPGILEAAGYHKCLRGEWPLVYCHTPEEDNIARLQRDADRKHCPAQQEGK